MTSRGAAAAASGAASAAAWQVVNSVTRCHLWQWPSQAMAMQAKPSQAEHSQAQPSRQTVAFSELFHTI